MCKFYDRKLLKSLKNTRFFIYFPDLGTGHYIFLHRHSIFRHIYVLGGRIFTKIGTATHILGTCFIKIGTYNYKTGTTSLTTGKHSVILCQQKPHNQNIQEKINDRQRIFKR